MTVSMLLKEMHWVDKERHHIYLRIFTARFEDLVYHTFSHIHHLNTHKPPVDVSERLAVALHYLASGSSQQAIAVSYRLGKSTVSQIVHEVC